MYFLKMDPLSIKNQAGPAQDPWPPKPSRPGPGPLAPQAKPVRPRTLGRRCPTVLDRVKTYFNGFRFFDSLGLSLKVFRRS